MAATSTDKPHPAVDWTSSLTNDEWLSTQHHHKWKNFFDKNGYLVVEDLLSKEEVAKYAELYRKFLVGEINAYNHRHDLGNHAERSRSDRENICQIMWPSDYVEKLAQGPLHQRIGLISKRLFGDDMAFDFDMLISKDPHTDTPTPWHADESYWPDMEDKRAVSCWCAMDQATVDNGCMWFVPGSHKHPMRPHRPVKQDCHVLTCDGSESEGIACQLRPGSATFHHGLTIHYTRGNTTDTQRRAYIANFRPQKMVEFERQQGYDHGRKGLGGTGILAGTKTHQNVEV